MAENKLIAWADHTNIAEELDADQLTKLGELVVEEYEIDLESRQEWETQVKKGVELARMIGQEKTYPWPKASNVLYPTIATAAIQFAARSLPNLIKGRDVVKGKVVGYDDEELKQQTAPQGVAMAAPEALGGDISGSVRPVEGAEPVPTLSNPVTAVPGDGGSVSSPAASPPSPREQKQDLADRLGRGMSDQLLEEMPDWEEELDILLTALPLIGCAFKKSYYDPTTGQPISEYCSAMDVVVNNRARSLETAPRITHVREFYPNEIIERQRSGQWLDIPFDDDEEGNETDASATDEFVQSGSDTDDSDQPKTFLEQHRWLDLIDDGYKQPYCVTVEKTSRKVVRIKARYEAEGVQANEQGDLVKIEPIHYFTKFPFLRAMDGSFYELGFGALLCHPTEIINGAFNRLMNASAAQTTGGGVYRKGVKVNRQAGGEVAFRQNEWKEASGLSDDIRKDVMPWPQAQPSPVLMELLKLVVAFTDKLASVTEALQGETPPAGTPASTTLAMIEQGLKVYTSIYKRLHRALSEEFAKIRRINAVYRNDELAQITLDRDGDGRVDVVPVSDPAEVSDLQKMTRARSLAELAALGANPREVLRDNLEALGVEQLERFLPPEQAPPDPEIQLKQQELELKGQELQLKAGEQEQSNARLMIELEQGRANVALTQAQAAKALAEVEALTQRLDEMQAEVRELMGVNEQQREVINGVSGPESGRVSGMGASPRRPVVSGGVGSPGGGQGSGTGPRTNGQPGRHGSNGASHGAGGGVLQGASGGGGNAGGGGGG